MTTQIHRPAPPIRDRSGKADRGFTLIELLVVVLIIGILAAIAIPVFLGQQSQAKDSAAKSDLGAAKIALVSYATATGAYTTTVANLVSYGYAASTGNSATAITLGATTSKFCIQTTSATGTTFKITYNGGVVSGACVAADVA
ncbi:MAG: type II secretion system protein [Rhodoglobus sp.]